MSKDLSFHLISNDPRNKVTRCFTYYTKVKTKVSSFLKFQYSWKKGNLFDYRNFFSNPEYTFM